MFKKTTLSNGLRIITVPQKSTQAVTVLVLVGTGSKYETREINGISHFLEHMFFKGTKNMPDKLEIAETLDKVGGIYNAFTGEEYTGYYAKTAFSKFDLALKWVSDIYLNSLLPEKEVKREKGVIIEEINMIYDNPMSRVGLLWNRLLYGDQPAGWDIAGTKETVSSIGRKDLFEYMKEQYTAPNTIVCVAGRIEEEEAIEKVKRYFSGMESSKPREKAEVIENQKKPGSLIDHKETDQTHLCLGVRGYNVLHPKKYAQDVLAVLLGGMMSSRLFMEVREKLGLAYYIKTESDCNPDTGFLVTQAGVENSNTQKAVSTILKEYRKISQKKVPAGELKKAKEYIKGKMALSLESSDELAAFYGVHELLEKRILTPKEIYAKIDKVTSSDVLAAAKEIFRPEGLNLALVGPHKDSKAFDKLLRL
jgi:predicted Zn-dependent peptidase